MRRTRNREAVLDSVLEFFEEGSPEPSIDMVAERAGVSNRSIYRYFDDRDHLIRTAMTHAITRLNPDLSLRLNAEGSLDDRIRRLVDHRLTIYQRSAAVTRAAKIAAVTEPLVAEQIDMIRMVARQQFVAHFEAEFRAVPAARRERAVNLAEIPLQFDSLEYLHRVTNGMVDEMRDLLVEVLSMHLEHVAASVATSSDTDAVRSDLVAPGRS